MSAEMFKEKRRVIMKVIISQFAEQNPRKNFEII